MQDESLLIGVNMCLQWDILIFFLSGGSHNHFDIFESIFGGSFGGKNSLSDTFFQVNFVLLLAKNKNYDCFLCVK